MAKPQIWTGSAWLDFYTLPSATSSVLGGVKVGSNISVSSGVISLTKANVTSALGYTPLQTHQDISGKLDKTTYEYNLELRATGANSGQTILIGKFPCYDTNITIEISATTSTTYNGTLVIATQNIAPGATGVLNATVYGDANNTITPAINIERESVSGSRIIAVYFKPQSYSKNLFHIQCQTPSAAPTDMMTWVSSVPAGEVRYTPVNALTANFNKYTLPTAASSTLGGIKLGYTNSGKNYKVQVDGSGNAYVNVPWSDTTYSAATTSAAGLMSATDKTNLNTLVNLLADNDSNTTVDTIREVLNVFASYPEGTTIANALATKATLSSSNTFTDGQKITRSTSGAILELESAASDTNFLLKRTNGATCVLESGSSVGLFGTKSNHSLQIRTNYVNRMTFDTSGGVTLATDVASASNSNQVATTKWVRSLGYTSNAGTVTSVKVGTTSYSPSSGVVSLPAYPTTLPASDVSSWAKASSKPTYTKSEVGLGNVLNVASYSKTEVNNLLANYVTLGDAQIITGDKTFNSNIIIGDSFGISGSSGKYIINGANSWDINGLLSAESGITVAAGQALKFNVINAPTASGGTTYGPGTSGQVLKSNGSTVYWASDSNSTTVRQYHTLTTASGDYPVTYSYTTATGTSSYKTTYVAVKSGFTFNPSTNALKVGGVQVATLDDIPSSTLPLVATAYCTTDAYTFSGTFDLTNSLVSGKTYLIKGFCDNTGKTYSAILYYNGIETAITYCWDNEDDVQHPVYLYFRNNLTIVLSSSYYDYQSAFSTADYLQFYEFPYTLGS